MARRAHSVRTPEKSRIRKDLEDGLSIRAVAKRWNLARSSITHIRDTATDRTAKSSGRPPLLSHNLLQRIERYVDLNWHTRTKSWPDLMREFNLTCSYRTFQSAMHKHGLGRYIAGKTPLRTRTQRNNRHLWGARHRFNSNEDWERILWTDECTFELDIRVPQRVTRRRGTRNDPMNTLWQVRRKSPGRLNIWGGIAHNYKSPLIWLDGSGKNGALIQKDYVEQVLEPHMMAMLEAIRQESGHKPVLMEDGNPAHEMKTKTNPAARWKALHGVYLLDWASNSPDLNPIEQIWRIIKQNLRKRCAEISTIAELKAAIQEEWDGISLSKINELISTMHKRADTVYYNWGDATGF